MSNLIGMFSVAAAGVGVMSAVLITLQCQDKKIKNRLSSLDNSEAVIFTKPGAKPELFDEKSCQAAWKAASKIATSMGGMVFYKSDTECAAKHHKFASTQDVFTVTPHAIGTTVTHYPPMIGWQALANNPAEAVPLYPGPVPGTAVRSDGKQFNI